MTRRSIFRRPLVDATGIYFNRCCDLDRGSQEIRQRHYLKLSTCSGDCGGARTDANDRHISLDGEFLRLGFFRLPRGCGRGLGAQLMAACIYTPLALAYVRKRAAATAALLRKINMHSVEEPLPDEDQEYFRGSVRENWFQSP